MSEHSTSPPESTEAQGVPSLPLLLWDGECGFCRRMVDYIRELVGAEVQFEVYQDFVDGDEVRVGGHVLDRSQLARGVHFIARDQTVYKNGEAALRTLAASSLWRFSFLLEAYRGSSVFAAVVEWGYRWVANHRRFANRVLRLFWGSKPRPAAWQLSRWLFLRLLGVVALIAFLSIWVQIDGLVGSDGILPASEFMKRAGEYLQAVSGNSSVGFYELRKLPTVFWWGASDSALHLVCGLGSLAAVLLITGVWPRLMLFTCWVLYLSISGVGQIFLGYQWDALLLEALLLSIWLAPAEIVPRWPWSRRWSDRKRVSRLALWLIWLLLFKLMVMSALAKLDSGDPAWTEMTALQYHFWTQPLPGWTAWYVDRLPNWVHTISTAVMFFIELVVPFFIFGPRRVRHWAAALLISLQVAIAATGTYGFFNLLTIALCLGLLDDDALRWLIPTRVRKLLHDARRSPQKPLVFWRFNVGLVVFSLLAVLVMTPVKRMVFPEDTWAWVTLLRADVRGLRSFNGYGLFATMTRYRREIRIEGSNDGEHWEAYRFEWKPGPLDQRPRFATPHMPRLDWQMWFAALSTCQSRRNTWLIRLQGRLLEGSPAVEDLFASVPFDEPPRFIRTLVFDYRFGEDTWWDAELLGAFCPPLTLDEQGELRAAHVESPEPAPPPPLPFAAE